MRFLDILTPRSLQTFMDSFPRFKEQGWINNLEFEMIRKDGTIMPVLLNATAVQDNEGNYVMSRSTLFDITERKQLDEEIRKAARDWQVTFDSIKDHVMILDEDFKIYRVNAAAASFFNLPLDKITNNHCFSLMHATDGPIDGLDVLWQRP
jgi:PAS domain-containing protein